MDAGDVIASRETEIGEFETSGELFDRLKTLGAELLVETVRKIASGDVVRVPQNEADATYTKMLHKEMCPIDWNKSRDREAHLRSGSVAGGHGGARRRIVSRVRRGIHRYENGACARKDRIRRKSGH